MAKAKVNMTCAKAAELSDMMGLASIIGSKRDAARATKIRLDAISRVLKMLARRKAGEYKGAGIEVLRAAIAKMSDDAQWWIDHRDDALHLVAKEIECANKVRLDEVRREQSRR